MTRWRWAFCALVFLAPPTMAADRAATLRASLDKAVPAALAKTGVPSVSIADVEGGRVVLTAAYGEQSRGVPASPATLYNLASLTKPITAETVLRLAGEGALSLDEPMAPVWTDPDIAKDERRALLTPRLSLSHQTGFPNWRRQTGGVLTFKFTPGQGVGYSGEGYEYLRAFVEKKTGTGLEAWAQTLVFKPVGMSATAYTRKPWFEGRIATPTAKDGTALPPEIADTALASDLVYATAGDYAKFLVSVMDHRGLADGLDRDRRTIQASTRAKSCAKSPTCPDDVGFGLGWEVFRFKDKVALLHTGRDKGVATFAYLVPSTRQGAVILTNGDGGLDLVLPVLEALGADAEFVVALRALED